MLPISTIKLLNRAIEHAKKKDNIFYAEVLQQIKEMILIEYQVQNKQLLN